MAEHAAVESTAAPDPSLQHLQAELARIDVLIRREVWRWQLAGQDPHDGFRGLHISAAEAEMLLQRPFAASWGQSAEGDPEEEQIFAAALAQAEQRVRSLVGAARHQGQPLRLEHLARAFGLDRFALDALLICLAPALDLRYGRLYAFLQDDVTRKHPSVNLVLDLLSESEPAHRLSRLFSFADGAPLFRNRFLERMPLPGAEQGPLLSQALNVDPALVAWLLGGFQPHADLAPHATLWQPPQEAAKSDVLLAAEVWPDVERVLDVEQPLLVFHGADGDSQRAAARLLAVRTGQPLLTVDLAAATASGLAPTAALHLALRDARLTAAIPCLTGWDACLRAIEQGEADGPAPKASEGSSPPPELLAELCAFPGPLVVAGRAAWLATGVERVRPFFWFEFPTPAYPQRRALWQHFLEGASLAGSEDVVDVTALAGQFALTAGQIRDAVASARDRAAQRGEGLQSRDLLAAARAHSNPRLSRLARKITPRYTWDDIVLPDDQLTLLHEIVATVRQRPLVLEAWGVGRKLASSPGVTMLFSGEPGTGKTMAAEVMAAELGLDLFKIDLSSIVSKYIGETEKNLEKIFGEAQSSNAILFFDEADAIFGKRSEVKDAHDRYANIEISYLLQRMEAYEGVTILATNLRANLDEAFTRRLQFAVDFPFPDEEYRLRIWETLFPPDVPREPDLDFGPLAHRFRLAGGNIRNVLVSAAYLAAADGGRVGMRHLLHGTRRELQKMGRLVNERDLAL